MNNDKNNSYFIPYTKVGTRPFHENMYNIYVLDKKTGDVNGDNIPDTVFLVGEKRENPFYENIKVIVQDGRTKKSYVISLYPNYSMAYTPWLVLGDFTDSNIDEIMVNLPVGGSGALTYYYVISFHYNNVDYLLSPEQFITLTQELEISVVYQDNYKVLIESKMLNQSYILDISDRKEVYEGSVYDKEGNLINPLEGFVIYLPHLYPTKFDGNQPYKLESQQDIAGTSHADQLGSIITYWKYKEDQKSWILDPELFYVMT